MVAGDDCVDYMVELKNVCYFNALKEICLSFAKGEIVILVGPNGDGKTSLLKIIAGINKPSSGVAVRKKNIRVGYMPQKIKFNPALPIDVKNFLTLERGIDKEYLYHKIKSVGVEHLLYKQIHDLSGGEMQKVLFVSALAKKPDLLVLDEPINHLDIGGRDKFYTLLEQEKVNSSIVMSSHDVHIVMKKAERVVCIDKKIRCSGHPSVIGASREFSSMLNSNLSIYKHEHSDT